ncbi:MAG: hypothetical protein QNJ16_21395 [Rhodobacter sp.]|nr:hypothetical protein [Rhodobacter sp.]
MTNEKLGVACSDVRLAESEIEERTSTKIGHRVLQSVPQIGYGRDLWELWCYEDKETADNDWHGDQVLGVVCDVPEDTPADKYC